MLGVQAWGSECDPQHSFKRLDALACACDSNADLGIPGTH